MDDREYRNLAKFARKAIVEIDAKEYRSGARQPPQPQDFGLSPSDLEAIRSRTDQVLALTTWTGGILLFAAMSWAAYSWLRPLDSLGDWVAVAAIGFFLAWFVGFGLLMGGAVGSVVLSPVLRRFFPRYIAARAYEDAVSEYQAWERRTHRAHWLALSPVQFEREVAALYKGLGCEVSLTPASGDKGIDIVLAKDGVISLVQCKAHDRPVGPAVVRELIGTLALHGPATGVIVSRSGFTSGARELAAGARIELVDLDRMLSFQYDLPDSTSRGRAV